ncbi:hypothetical protein GCM10011591_27480 [Nocardia camponoti]|uniref:Uncharacterized protein n=2 Tax=Nocardia camponoti TaxID=1616106 RepID=A0A917V9Y0_9NOCA|nr:hypothetical protein GCM10011591_27480 [Nocardia camponoti]
MVGSLSKSGDERTRISLFGELGRVDLDGDWVTNFVEMWNSLSAVADIFDCEWEDLAGWRKCDGAGEPKKVNGKDSDDVAGLVTQTKELGEICLMNRKVDPILALTLRFDKSDGTASLSLIAAEPGERGDFSFARDLFGSERQMADMLHIVVEAWHPLACFWTVSRYIADQMPRPTFSLRRSQLGVEWTTTLGWLTYLSADWITIPPTVQWPDGVLVDRVDHGVFIQAEEYPSSALLLRIIEIRNALGWPSRTQSEAESLLGLRADEFQQIVNRFRDRGH